MKKEIKIYWMYWDDDNCEISGAKETFRFGTIEECRKEFMGWYAESRGFDEDDDDYDEDGITEDYVIPEDMDGEIYNGLYIEHIYTLEI